MNMVKKFFTLGNKKRQSLIRRSHYLKKSFHASSVAFLTAILLVMVFSNGANANPSAGAQELLNSIQPQLQKLKSKLPVKQYASISDDIEVFAELHGNVTAEDRKIFKKFIEEFSLFVLSLKDLDRENYLEVFEKLRDVATPAQLYYYQFKLQGIKTTASSLQFTELLNAYKNIQFKLSSKEFLKVFENLIDLQGRMGQVKLGELSDYLVVLNDLQSYKERLFSKDPELKISKDEFMLHQDILLNKRKAIFHAIKLKKYTPDVMRMIAYRLIDYDFKERGFPDYIGYDTVVPRSEKINNNFYQGKLPISDDKEMAIRNHYQKGFIDKPAGYTGVNGEKLYSDYRIAYSRFARADGEPVLNVHGFLNAQAAFDYWSKAEYIVGYDAWEISQPGYGSKGEKTLLKSEYRPGDYDYINNVAVMDAAVAHIFAVTGKKVTITGFSMGGMTVEAFMAGAVGINADGSFILDAKVAQLRASRVKCIIPFGNPPQNLAGVAMKVQLLTRGLDPVVNGFFKYDHGHVPMGVGADVKDPNSKSYFGQILQSINKYSVVRVSDAVIADIGVPKKLGFDKYYLDIMFKYRYSAPHTDSLRSMNRLYLAKDFKVDHVVSNQIPIMNVLGSLDKLANVNNLFQRWADGYKLYSDYNIVILDGYGHVNLMAENAVALAGDKVFNFMQDPHGYSTKYSAFEAVSDEGYLSQDTKNKMRVADRLMEETEKYKAQKINLEKMRQENLARIAEEDFALANKDSNINSDNVDRKTQDPLIPVIGFNDGNLSEGYSKVLSCAKIYSR